MPKHTTREKKFFSKYKTPLVPFPNLLETQISSFDWLIESGLKEVFKEFSPISDYSGKSSILNLSLLYRRTKTRRALCSRKQAFLRSAFESAREAY